MGTYSCFKTLREEYDYGVRKDEKLSNALRTEIMGLGLNKPMDRYGYDDKAAMDAQTADGQ